MAALQTSRNAHILAWLLRFRIGLRLALRGDPRLWNHFYAFRHDACDQHPAKPHSAM